YFLERSLIPTLIQALKPGGLVFYQTFTRQAVSSEGPQNPAFRLADQELLQLFSQLHVRVYREEGRLGDLSLGSRDVAMLVAQK
ncbi:MAG: SAM-dependent methyltransferase, partial [Candidatus Thiodiazotropha taylori]